MEDYRNKYFDNACTSFPKPAEVGNAMLKHLNEGGSYGRAAYNRIISSTRAVEETREKLGSIIGTRQFSNIVFDYNATSAINKILSGFNFKHKKALVSPLEHNAIMRPLTSLGLNVEILPHNKDGYIAVEQISPSMIEHADMVIVNHISNVNGVVQPISQLKEVFSGTPLLVDASQSLGKVEVLADEWNIDFVAFTGHKGLLGPTGTGGFYVKNPDTLNATVLGGTGSNSASFEMPNYMPDKFQAGTPNITGIYGLQAALNNKPKNSWDWLTLHSILNELKQNSKIRVLCAEDYKFQSDVFSIFPCNEDVSGFAYKLNNEYGIQVRSGLHCSPLAHKTFGTFPKGSVRFSLSPYHTNNDLDFLYSNILKAIQFA